MMQRPVVHFHSFTGGPPEGPRKRVTGTFTLEGNEVALTLNVLEEVKGDVTTEGYRRQLVKIRDALTDMIENPHGIRV